MAQKFDKIIFLICFCIPIVLDRITKYCMISGIWQSQEINQFFNLYLTHNHGVAWGVGGHFNQSVFPWIHVLVACVLIYFVWYMRFIAHNRNMLIACLLVLAGGISNFFDRLWYGSVIDFIQLHLGEWYFAVFNVADISITFGAVLLTYFVLTDDAS